MPVIKVRDVGRTKGLLNEILDETFQTYNLCGLDIARESLLTPAQITHMRKGRRNVTGKAWEYVLQSLPDDAREHFCMRLVEMMKKDGGEQICS